MDIPRIGKFDHDITDVRQKPQTGTDATINIRDSIAKPDQGVLGVSLAISSMKSLKNEIGTQKIKEDRAKKWQRQVEEIDKITDALGYPIDKDIKSIVIALNANGINTIQSCGGHLEGEHSIAPIVDIAAKGEPLWHYENQRAVYEETAKKYNVPVEKIIGLNASDPENLELRFKAYCEANEESFKNPETQEFKKWKEENRRLGGVVEKLLSDFYKDRDVPGDVKIKMTDFGPIGNFSIYCGEGWMEKTGKRINLSHEQRHVYWQNIDKYHKEMNDFSQFLKDKFIEEGEGYLK